VQVFVSGRSFLPQSILLGSHGHPSRPLQALAARVGGGPHQIQRANNAFSVRERTSNALSQDELIPNPQPVLHALRLREHRPGLRLALSGRPRPDLLPAGKWKEEEEEEEKEIGLRRQPG